MSTKRLRSRLDEKKGEKRQIEKKLETANNSINQLEKDIERGENAKDVVRTVALQTQQQLEYRIASTVSAAEYAVFEDPYSLNVEFNQRRGKTECDLLFERDGYYRNPLAGSGYGAVDIAAFALRVACWSMSRKTRPVLILDEPFKHLKGEAENRRAIDMVKEISNQLGLQIIMVSDERAPRDDIIEGADKVFLPEKKNGESTIKGVE